MAIDGGVDFTFLFLGVTHNIGSVCAKQMSANGFPKSYKVE
jgi:hypothetical protein